eukprot:TRINITY_DN2823_c0_g1_i4.p2 TRINITY_DN2823_c0_g1~~TRINITY_DN2823_c0_g1_i4.p2  ORF type:complete len:192 (+),score=46.78 TRINITY_DN2823_c0_g1_i4:113-688(+)
MESPSEILCSTVYEPLWLLLLYPYSTNSIDMILRALLDRFSLKVKFVEHFIEHSKMIAEFYEPKETKLSVNDYKKKLLEKLSETNLIPQFAIELNLLDSVYSNVNRVKLVLVEYAQIVLDNLLGKIKTRNLRESVEIGSMIKFLLMYSRQELIADNALLMKEKLDPQDSPALTLIVLLDSSLFSKCFVSRM